MKSAMIFPSFESEKAIANYSLSLTKSIRKKGLLIEDLNYSAGRPTSLLKNLFKFKRYDVLHVQHEYNLLGWYGIPFFLLYFILLLSRARIITTMHTVLSQKEKFKDNFFKKFLRKLLYKVQNRIIRMVSHKVIVHADFFKNILVEEYGFKKEKIHVFPQAILEDIKMTPKSKAKKELNLSGPIYLVIGSFVPDHGADIAIRAAKDAGKTVLVVLSPKSVNDRNDDRIKKWLEYNKEIVKRERLEEYVRFDVKMLPRSLWWKYFSAADLVLLPYRGGIGSGIFADAIATKRPVICSNIKYFNEYAKQWGFLRIAKTDKDFAKEIKEAMKKKNYPKMVKECERFIKKYGLSVLAEEYKKLYLSLLD